MGLALCREAVMAFGRNRAQAAAERTIAMVTEASSLQAGVIVADSAGGVGYSHNAEVMEIALFHPIEGIRHRVLEPLVPHSASARKPRK
jgi:isoaspartyl peptidase/L-asparaginase-like protein (Ntn-hydrolase superfamily)